MRQNPFGDIVKSWKELKFKKLGLDTVTRRQSTQVQIERYLNKDILPVLGDRVITEITRADVLVIQRNIEARGALSIAAKCRGWLNEIFRQAIAEGHIDLNPASEMDIVALPPILTNHNPYLVQNEIPELLKAIKKYKGARQTRLSIQLLLLTGVRTGELRFATIDQFDFKAAMWVIPALNVKQLKRRAKKTEKGKVIPPYLVPLSEQAIAIVQELLALRHPKQSYLLCHQKDLSKTISENTLNQALKRMGFKNRLTGHGIRATISTALNEIGCPEDWVEAQLSHSGRSKNAMRATYNHAEYVEQRRVMMQEWADQLDIWAES